ncbi:MAG: energy transducer TonB [Candidatus Thiodiazotropha taylori]|uniref:Protein TonB n=1 Tax=Candidatus Thiodiazotropha taylori TaxID=2792791 RepID=A0A9E4N2E5_9GAMM|nr:energy transducer TonB [Candidatus Thiodiazotropha taylori]MCG7962722.1 energy transducer TonB [Candidatus Thiodiazotropha endolucinida]MCG7917764.1 energy transducer TonB [Candidatus Thiodiazotropha taylori]MCG7942520.1 energy transducer TonB [Candidatus Thiodiazotropha taylori]MCG7945606.1 energy transducer TonB [Candidatus Thiodiazotropha taylori]
MRLLLALLIAMAVNLALFLLLDRMVSEKEIQVDKLVSSEIIEFVRLKSEPEPPPQQEPEQIEELPEPPPAVPETPLQPLAVDRPELAEWQIPELDIPLQIGTGPYIGVRPQMPTTLAAEPVPRMRFPPRYPQRALMRHVEGKVVLRFTINPDGSVSDAEVIEAEPVGYFEQSALRAISRWQFHPKVVDGKAVSRVATQTISYRLN